MPKKKSADKSTKPLAPRFGIGEWYGRSFVNLDAAERKQIADIALKQALSNSQLCPFKPVTDKKLTCNKLGGICSLRLYDWQEEATASATIGPEGDLRAVCPNRFKQDGTIFRQVSRFMLGIDYPLVVNEVRFLQRITSTAASTESDGEPTETSDVTKEDVGNIDCVLVDPADSRNWCALEIQTVYFSGEKMKHLFEHIRDFPTDSIPFPDRNRRPDYRSSGPKRLMPQLQIKVPTLRRWGKKMAVVVDKAWFRTNVVNVETVSDVSNADIAWFLVDYDETTDPATIIMGPPELQTLERSVEGLTGGAPVTLREFEAKISEKLAKQF